MRFIIFFIPTLLILQPLNADWQSHNDFVTKQRKGMWRAYKNLMNNTGDFFLDSKDFDSKALKNLNMSLKCDVENTNYDKEYTQKYDVERLRDSECDKGVMCYFDKCFFDGDLLSVYAMVLSQYIYMRQSDKELLRQILPRIKDMLELGLPDDESRHDFSFISASNVRCRYYIWQKEREVYELNLSGCNENLEVTHTFYQLERGVMWVYKVLDVKNY